MSKKTKYLIITILAILLPMHVNADCQSDFKKYEKDFKVSYSYNKDTDDFTLTFVNPDYKKYSYMYKTMDELQSVKRSSYGNTLTGVLEHYKKSEYEYGIMALYEGCNKILVKQETIYLKKYNPYADDPLCKGNEEFVLCQKEYENKIDRDSFEYRIKEYINEKNNSENVIKNNYDNNKNNEKDINEANINVINKYLSNNIWLVIITVIILVLLAITITILISKKIKSRRLE